MTVNYARWKTNKREYVAKYVFMVMNEENEKKNRLLAKIFENFNSFWIPKNNYKRSIWIKAIALDKLQSLFESAVVCCLHFIEDWKYICMWLIRFQENAIPNVLIKTSIHSEVNPIKELSNIQFQQSN